MPGGYLIAAPQFRLSPHYPLDHQVFKDSDDAEIALCMDRAGFLQQDVIRTLIPRSIWMHIIHDGDSAQIRGFQNLFVLNADPRADDLRRLFFNYFANSLSLRAHLSKFVFFQMNHVLKGAHTPVTQAIPAPRQLSKRSHGMRATLLQAHGTAADVSRYSLIVKIHIRIMLTVEVGWN
jgi:hypothetical protein